MVVPLNQLKYFHTNDFVRLLGPFKKLNCLDDTKTSFLGPLNSLFFYKKILHALKALKALKPIKA